MDVSLYFLCWVCGLDKELNVIQEMHIYISLMQGFRCSELHLASNYNYRREIEK